MLRNEWRWNWKPSVWLQKLPRPPGVNIYVDYAQGGSFFEWTKTLDGALRLDFDTVIPGHGPVSTRDEVVKFRANLEAMRNRMIRLIRTGTPKSDIVKTLEAALVKALNQKDLQQKMLTSGAELVPDELMTSQGFAAYIKKEYELTREAAKIAGLTPS